jgi:hypothetical protein
MQNIDMFWFFIFCIRMHSTLLMDWHGESRPIHPWRPGPDADLRRNQIPASLWPGCLRAAWAPGIAPGPLRPGRRFKFWVCCNQHSSCWYGKPEVCSPWRSWISTIFSSWVTSAYIWRAVSWNDGRGEILKLLRLPTQGWSQGHSLSASGTVRYYDIIYGIPIYRYQSHPMIWSTYDIIDVWYHVDIIYLWYHEIHHDVLAWYHIW